METTTLIRTCCLIFLSLTAYTLFSNWIVQPCLFNGHFNQNYDKSVENRNSKSSIPDIELYEIMTKQYDVPNGTYEGAPYKKILYWNELMTLSSLQYGVGVGKDAFKKAGCPVWQCETSMDKSDLSQYDALLFCHNTWDGSMMPKERWPHQRYIFMEFESANWPTNGISIYKYGFFNWTMTYRLDSDIVHPYGWIEPINASSVPLHPEPEQLQQLIAESNLINLTTVGNKTKMAAWFSSRCNNKHVTSGREKVVDELIKHGVQIDIYGSCGNLTCGNRFDNKTDEQDETCRKMAAENYKFYLAFENSLCLDYVSEKFYAMMYYYIIPVVMDVHNNHARVAPPHSYINVMDYSSTKDLADYLILLSQNDTLYNEYFWWKPHFKIRNRLIMEGLHYRTFCSLCAALHNPEKHANKQTSFYSDFYDWWKIKSRCRKVTTERVLVETDTGLPYYVGTH